MKLAGLSFRVRAKSCVSVVGQRLLNLMDDKQTNLALSADVTSADQLLDLANQLGPEICVLKTHIDIIENFSPAFILELVKLSKEHQFLLFEDRKFADIGNTVKHQYSGGMYRIADWSDFTNAHSLPGPGIIQGLAEVGLAKQRGLILLAEMSSAGHLMHQDYINSTLQMAKKFSDFVFGFITQHALSNEPHWINLTPGVKLEADSDSLGQQYVTPQQAILENGTDIIIVGRGILAAKDPHNMARQYRQAAWHAYKQRLQQS